MFTELNNLCNISPESLPSGKFILIGEDDADGSFILNHMLSIYLRAKRCINILALSQTFTHYNTICSKLGVNLSKARDTGEVVFHAGIQEVGGAMLQEACSEPTPCIFRAKSDNSSLRELYQQLKDSSSRLKTTDEILFLIDDLSVLLSIGIPARDISVFVQYLRNYVNELGGCLVVLTHHRRNVEDEDLDCLWKELHYMCDLCLYCKGLDSGYSHEVHGQMIIKRKNSLQSKFEPNYKRVMQYKISDKNVTFFAPGLSSAVL